MATLTNKHETPAIVLACEHSHYPFTLVMAQKPLQLPWNDFSSKTPEYNDGLQLCNFRSGHRKQTNTPANDITNIKQHKGINFEEQHVMSKTITLLEIKIYTLKDTILQ